MARPRWPSWWATRLCSTWVSALAEGVTLAETTGLGADVVGEFVALMFGGPYVGYFERMKNGDYYKKEVSGCLSLL